MPTRRAYATLYEVLVTFAKVLAPFMPFVTERSTSTWCGKVDPARGVSIFATTLRSTTR